MKLFTTTATVIIIDKKTQKLSFAHAGDSLLFTTDTRGNVTLHITQPVKKQDAELKKIPIMLIVGEKERDSHTASIRRRHKGDLGSKPIDELVASMLEEIKTRRRH